MTDQKQMNTVDSMLPNTTALCLWFTKHVLAMYAGAVVAVPIIVAQAMNFTGRRI